MSGQPVLGLLELLETDDRMFDTLEAVVVERSK